MRALLTAAEAAEYLGIAKKTLYASWKFWKIPAVRIGGNSNGALRFRVKDLDALIDQWTTDNPR